jgi:hypothetical protein
MLPTSESGLRKSGPIPGKQIVRYGHIKHTKRFKSRALQTKTPNEEG